MKENYRYLTKISEFEKYDLEFELERSDIFFNKVSKELRKYPGYDVFNNIVVNTTTKSGFYNKNNLFNVNWFLHPYKCISNPKYKINWEKLFEDLKTYCKSYDDKKVERITDIFIQEVDGINIATYGLKNENQI